MPTQAPDEGGLSLEDEGTDGAITPDFVRDIVSGMPQPYGAILELVYFEGYTQQDAFRAANIDRSKGKLALKIAMTAMRARLEPIADANSTYRLHTGRVPTL